MSIPLLLITFRPEKFSKVLLLNILKKFNPYLVIPQLNKLCFHPNTLIKLNNGELKFGKSTYGGLKVTVVLQV